MLRADRVAESQRVIHQGAGTGAMAITFVSVGFFADRGHQRHSMQPHAENRNAANDFVEWCEYQLESLGRLIFIIGMQQQWKSGAMQQPRGRGRPFNNSFSVFDSAKNLFNHSGFAWKL